MPAGPAMPEVRRALPVLAAVLVLHLLLVLPPYPGGLAPASLFQFPLELPLAILLLLAFPGRPLRAALTLLLLAATVLKLADLGTEMAFRRPFNPVLDADLVPAAWRLAVDIQVPISTGVSAAGGAASGCRAPICSNCKEGRS